VLRPTFREFIGQIGIRVLIGTEDEATTIMDAFIKKTIPTDIFGISRMMKGYSSRAVSDKMDV
jgi:hypothetical protein